MKTHRCNNNVCFQIVGVDLFPDFVERAIVNHDKYKKYIVNNDKIRVDFMSTLTNSNALLVADYLEEDQQKLLFKLAQG